MYTGPLVMRSVVSERLYKHLLTLTVALSVLLNPYDNFRNSHLENAREHLVYFVKHSPHALIHVADDLEHYRNSLNGINAFQFENH